MRKLEAVFAVALGVALVAVLIWGIAKATKDLANTIAMGIGNISTPVE